MTRPRSGRFTADLSGHDEVVVFLLGFRPNRLRKVRSWWPVVTAMAGMLRYFDAHPQQGLLGSRTCLSPWPTVIQYWRSFEDLERFSRAPSAPHLEPWRSFNRLARTSADVGIWHETYRVRADQLETIYTNVPDIGLGKALGCVAVRPGRDTAAERLGVRADPAPDGWMGQRPDEHSVHIGASTVTVTGASGPAPATWALLVDGHEVDSASTAGELRLRGQLPDGSDIEAAVRQSADGPTEIRINHRGQELTLFKGFAARGRHADRDTADRRAEG